VDELPGYRPVSVLAVTAAIAGVCSAAALAAPVLWMVPLVGVGLSLAALADVAGPSSGGKAGRLAALVGLALSLGFGAQAAVTAGGTHWLTCRRAEAAARYWLDAVCDGRLADARSMANPDGVREGEPGAPAVDTALGMCGGPARTVRCDGAGPAAESWRVRALGEGTAAELVLVRRPGARGAERWFVAACAPVTPSTN
jgi:hypothetical protein